MQTFLPYPDFYTSASVLDNKRLNKQITEVKQILQSLLGESKAWSNHPGVKMWKGCELALMNYGNWCYLEWMIRHKDGKRGGKKGHKAGDWTIDKIKEQDKTTIEKPSWLGNEAFHSAHRAILLAKDYDWYSRFGWNEKPASLVNGKFPYVWPDSRG